MELALLVAASLLVSLKVVALTIANIRTVASAAPLIALVNSGADTASIRAEIHRLSPVDRFISSARPRLFWDVFAEIFRGPILITIGTALILVYGKPGSNWDWLILYLGLAVALCTMLHLVVAVLRPLVVGREAWRTPDVAVPKPRFAETWAVHQQPGANVAIYFLILAYIAVVGFAGLYCALDAASHTAFAVAPSNTAFVWIYFSATTVSTIGFGDVTAHSLVAQIAVTVQIAVGPLLLSWLIAVLLSPSLSTVLPRVQHSTEQDGVLRESDRRAGPSDP